MYYTIGNKRSFMVYLFFISFTHDEKYSRIINNFIPI